MDVCWKHDKLTGEANFDIDNEKINLNKPTLFPEYDIPTKRQVFDNSLKEKILNQELKTDKEIYLYTLNEGFLCRDANAVFKKLAKEEKIILDFKTTNSSIHKISAPSVINIK